MRMVGERRLPFGGCWGSMGLSENYWVLVCMQFVSISKSQIVAYGEVAFDHGLRMDF